MHAHLAIRVFVYLSIFLESSTAFVRPQITEPSAQSFQTSFIMEYAFNHIGIPTMV